MNTLIASLQFISSIPLGKARPFDARAIIVNFPLAGMVIGLGLALFDLLVTALWPPLVAAALDVTLLAVLTGGFHLDGLADAADGLYGQRERAKRLAIMKDSRVGAMGLTAVVCTLLAKFAALGSLDHGRFLALCIVPAFARGAMIFGMRFLSYARGEEGTGSAFFEARLSVADFRYLAVPLILSLFLGWRGVLLAFFFAAGTATLLLIYKKKLNGITGDMLGAMTELMEAVLFLAAAAGGAT